MPFGHLVDLLWRWKSLLVYVGAGVIAASLLIMVGLIGHRGAMVAVMPSEVWYVLSMLLSPIGCVIQDTVADAMTVEAVPPRWTSEGQPIERTLKLVHRCKHSGAFAIIGIGILVSLINLYLFTGVQNLPKDKVAEIYQQVYLLALTIPAVSVLGVITASILRMRAKRRFLSQGLTPEQIAALLDRTEEPTKPNWWILGGSLAFVLFTLTVGVGDFPYSEEIVFVGSMAIVSVLMVRLTRELDPPARHVLVGTALVVFVFRAVPGPGEGATWWMIDQLKFDQQFLSVLSLIGSALTLAGMFLFRRFMAERSIAYVVGILTVAAFFLGLPIVSMYYGLHQWTSAMTGGLVDARFIALVNTALESPLGQISMIPMLAWIANSAPANLKATYFAVMASFTNLALSLSQLGTKYLNELFVVTREVRDPVTNAIQTPDDYSQLGMLLIVQTVLGLALPFAAILFARFTRFRSA
ncbi:MAG: hypothetical protein MRJ92_13005 [Nitrospira sp.]|nr:hypothetical protein [Nitrospira sp.]